MVLPDKRAIVAALRERIRGEIAGAHAAAHDAARAATHEEARPENDKDTRAIEASYLAGAQAERVRDLREAHATLAALPLRAFAAGEPVAAGALVTAELDGEPTQRAFFFIAPFGGGRTAALDGRAVQVVTPRSPLGQALLGRTVGELVEVVVRGQTREYEIVAIA